MNPLWSEYAVPAMRSEALYGDRVVRCFAERPPGLWAMFERACAERSSEEALVCEGRRWSYAALRAEAERLAGGLAAEGITAGDRVLMLLSNRPEFVFMLLALQRLGAIAVPVGVREPRPGLAYIAQQCGAVGIAYDDELADRVPDAAEAPALRLRLAATALAPLAANAPAALQPWTSPSETDTGVILYTSGTTGRPKGAMLTHLAIAHSVLHYQVCMRLHAGDRSALAVPASHVTGLIAIIAAMWQVGGATIVVPTFKAETFVPLLAAERITHTLIVPAMYQLCLMHAAPYAPAALPPRGGAAGPGDPDPARTFAGHDLSAWRVGGYGGAPMPVSTIDALAAALPGLTLLNCYGATETTSPATMMPHGPTRAHIDSVGIALPGADIRVMDDEGRELPPGETGELWIGGPMVVPGYWANPEATAASFTAGFWHSGDLGSVDARGYVRIFDRKKDMLNRGGFKIYSVEVENVLMGWPGVVEAAVIGIPCPVLGERVHAVLHAPGAAADEAALKRHCTAQLADYKVPESFTWSAEPLPRNANGKVMKRLLRDRVGTR